MKCYSRSGWMGFLGLSTTFISSGCLTAETYPGDLTAGTGAPTGGTGAASATGGAATAGSAGMGGAGTAGAGGTSVGGASTGGTGGQGGGPVCSPEGPFNGPPVNGVTGEWTWVDVPEAKCRNGSTTGFGVRLRPESGKLLIYFGGRNAFGGSGACFNGASCLQAEYEYPEWKFDVWKTNEGKKRVFKTDNDANAFKDWNAVYVPYCTGDLHSGGSTEVDVPDGGPENQSFVGYRNVGLFLGRLVPAFPDVTKVVVMGVGAGGFGATFNYHRVAQAFCPATAILIDDAGPLMDDTYLAPCLQSRLRKLWGVNPNFPLDCTDCTVGDGGMVNYFDYLSSRYPEGRFALISSMEDDSVRSFYGSGEDNCAGFDSVTVLPLSESDYTDGLNTLRAEHMDGPASWASYYIPGSQHGHLDQSYSSTTVDGIKLIDWVADVVNDKPMVHVPAP